MNKVLVIGIVGESVFMKCDHFHKTGETIKVDNIYTEIGGKGFNQALTIKELGGNVKFICALGLDKKKDEIVNEINNFTLDIELIQILFSSILDNFLLVIIFIYLQNLISKVALNLL